MFGRRAVTTVGVRSMLSFRLFVEHMDLVATLSLYSWRLSAFDRDSSRMGLFLATHGGSGLAATLARERVVDLEKSLEDSREIGIAVGIVMARHRVTREQAFDLLRLSSQQAHRKVAELAADIARTGDLPALNLRSRR